MFIVEGKLLKLALEELKKYDMWFVVKNDKVTSILKDIMRSVYKTVDNITNR